MLEPLGIQVRQFGALTRLADGTSSQRELADRLQVSTPVVVELVDGLEARGLVERRRDTADRRLNAVHVTGGGRDVLERATAVLRGRERGLDAADRRRGRPRAAVAAPKTAWRCQREADWRCSRGARGPAAG